MPTLCWTWTWSSKRTKSMMPSTTSLRGQTFNAHNLRRKRFTYQNRHTRHSWFACVAISITLCRLILFLMLSGFTILCPLEALLWGTEIRCLAVGKARMNSIVPCTPILAIRLRINGPDDMNSPCYRVHLQCACYSDLCTVHPLQKLCTV
jgi:hypothetical protein